MRSILDIGQSESRPKPIDAALGRIQRSRVWVKKATVLGMDILLLFLAYLSATILRLGEISFPLPEWVLISLGLMVLVSAIVVPVSGLSRSIWRYASLPDFLIIARTITIALLVHTFLLFLITRNQDIPRSVPAITWFIGMIYLSAPRVLYRLLKDRWFGGLKRLKQQNRQSIILFGSPDSTEHYLRSTRRDSNSRYQVSGIFEISPTHVGREIYGVRMLGGIEDIDGFLERAKHSSNPPRHIVVAGGNIPHAMIRKLMKLSGKFNISLARLPEMGSLEGPKMLAQQQKFKAIQLEDVLGRQPVNNDLKNISGLIRGQRILVTGAGGSIGSELTRQIASFEPSRLTMLDNSEFNLFEIENDIKDLNPTFDTEVSLCSVQNRDQIIRVILDEKPDVIFHAAALKHVPLVEKNPWQGVQVNVLGTQNVADGAKLARVKAFIMISTDKAVNPTNVMGVTKKIAEKYCQALDLDDGVQEDGDGHTTRYLTVRFGNVLGSAGSVVPFFERQIEHGGPVTVTHPDIERYFMSIKEAVELVLHASSFGMTQQEERGQIFVLEMGKPVKIMDVARQLIRLAGYVPDEEIKIRVVGLRPGEKMTEELFAAEEPVAKTKLDGVLAARARPVDIKILKNLIKSLGEAAQNNKTEKLLVLLKNIVPEYTPSPEFERLIQRQTSLEIIHEILANPDLNLSDGSEGKSKPETDSR